MDPEIWIAAVTGFPAWAGIDPNEPGAKRASQWFPRMGGDRPSPSRMLKQSTQVSPHGRG